MVVGETGTGKSVLVQGFLARPAATTTAFGSIQAAFSAQTAAKNMQDLLESKLDKLRKNLLGAPPAGTRSSSSTTSTCPRSRSTARSRRSSSCARCSRQGGFYDLKKLFFKRGAEHGVHRGVRAAGRRAQRLTARLVRHFNLLWVPELSPRPRCSASSSPSSTASSSGGFGEDVKELAEPASRRRSRSTARCARRCCRRRRSRTTPSTCATSPKWCRASCRSRPPSAPTATPSSGCGAHETSARLLRPPHQREDRAWFRVRHHRDREPRRLLGERKRGTEDDFGRHLLRRT